MVFEFLRNAGAFIVALGILVAVHEWGHYYVARLCGVYVKRFSIGFGKPLWRKQGSNGTEFVVAAIPLGGYVRMLDERVDDVPAELSSQAFNRQSVAKRMAIIAAGPVSEFINGVTSYSLKPLYIGIFFGFCSLLLSIALVVYALFAKFNGLAIPGSTGIIITISFFSAILLLTIGIMGIYIARIFEQTKGRDQYVIKNIKTKN